MNQPQYLDDLKTLRAFCEIATISSTGGPPPNDEQIGLADLALERLQRFLEDLAEEERAQQPLELRIAKLIFGDCLEDDHRSCVVGVSIDNATDRLKRRLADPDNVDRIVCDCPCHLPAHELARRWREMEARTKAFEASSLSRSAAATPALSPRSRALEGSIDPKQTEVDLGEPQPPHEGSAR